MSTSGANRGPAGGTSGILTDPRQAAEGKDGGEYDEPESIQKTEDDEAEEGRVTKKWEEYNKARKFDENFRKQIAIDRRYAAGISDLSWAVTTNLIGAFIDILVALLYARNPDVSVRKSPQVDESNTYQMQVFARTLEIVISRLWKDGRLKVAARKGVRSVLSNGEGWFKCTMVSAKKPQPEVEAALNDAQETHARLIAQQKLLEDPADQDPETLDAEKAEKEALIKELTEKVEIAVSKMFVIDYVATENIQVSTDIDSIDQYLDADWIGNETYLTKEAHDQNPVGQRSRGGHHCQRSVAGARARQGTDGAPAHRRCGRETEPADGGHTAGEPQHHARLRKARLHFEALSRR